MKIGIIGTGNLGKSILDCMIENNIPLAASNTEPSAYRGIKIMKDNVRLANQSDIIILAVKPQSMDEVLKEISGNVKNKLIITFAAGLKIGYYQKRIDAKIARVMTNLAIRYGKGVSAYILSKNCTQEDRQKTEKILFCLGKCIEIEDEDILDIVTGVSGSGIAYFIKIMDIFERTGIKHGMDKKQAKTLVIETVKGAIAMMENTDETNEALIKKVASKGGTTEQGLKELDEKNIDMILSDTIKKTIDKCKAIGDTYD